ncbi:MAG: glycoside hydrolase family 2 TIM barrel-domain containing protein [Ruminococcus sp.]|uniref:glycoside hydrolase family 2 TIM barrel-domain containing protein n=1 Tax=Ruminococcus sp. TaxID=41978 RepID=UPI003992CD8B
MIERIFNENWSFWPEVNSFSLQWEIPADARTVTLPHDAMIENPAFAESLNGGNTGYRDGGIYNYAKMLYVPESKADRKLVLRFEGVYMNAFVYINGQLACKNPFGYNTFYVELNRYLKYNMENEIRVQVRAGAMTNSRWYSGAGIYRDVYLMESGLVGIDAEGVKIKTEEADAEYAILQVNTKVQNLETRSKKLLIRTEICDRGGNCVTKEETRLELYAGEEQAIYQRMTVRKPNLWNAESPSLYMCKSYLYEVREEKNRLLDVCEEKFGIRMIQVDAQRGLRINGKVEKLRGGCIHHDSGLLGAATYEAAQYRQIRKMKEAGFNAIRMSHHPMAPAMLRACDEIGMYVMDEAFDMWTRCKSDYDYGLYFNEWWESDIEGMVKKDYNHPSVILYSIGNEIPEIGTKQGMDISKAICEKIKIMDNSRFTLAAVNGVFAVGDRIPEIVADVSEKLLKEGNSHGNVNDFMSLMMEHMGEIVVHPIITERLENACASTDIAGYNYMTARYEMDGERYPNRVIVGSETYSPQIAENWGIVEQKPYVIGDFCWTGWDYIGEAGIGIPAYQFGEGSFGARFPAQLAYVGDFDITGFRRPMSYYREIVFGQRTDPYIAVQDPNKYGQNMIKSPWVMSDTQESWSWSGCDNQPVVVEVYAAGTEVELFVNGKSQGKKAAGKAAGFRTLFETVYELGEIVAVSYDQEGEMGRFRLRTAGEAAKLELKEEDVYGQKDQKLHYVEVRICDVDGITATDCDQELSVSISGNAELLGFGSGDPKPLHNYNEGRTRTYQGRAMLILKEKEQKCDINIRICAENELEVESVINS